MTGVILFILSHLFCWGIFWLTGLPLERGYPVAITEAATWILAILLISAGHSND